MVLSSGIKAALLGLLCFVSVHMFAQDSTKVKVPILKIGVYRSGVDEKIEFYQADLSYYFSNSIGISTSIGVLRSWEMPLQFSDEYVSKLPYDRKYFNYDLKFDFRPIHSKRHELVLSAGFSGVSIEESECYHVGSRTRDDLGGIVEYRYTYKVNDAFLFGSALEVGYNFYLTEHDAVGVRIISKQYKEKEKADTRGVENFSVGLNYVRVFNW